tara:strand:+ start:140 stop:556 length:417 start_codon:yes stop_codon:yes gene_type:complete
MKKILLILLLSIGFINIVHSGSDDRDQVLPLNSLNEEQTNVEDESPRFLEEGDETIVQNEEIQQGQKEIEALIQTKLIVEKTEAKSIDDIETEAKSESGGKIQLFIDQYIKSDQGILIMLFLFVISLILIFNYFVREK